MVAMATKLTVVAIATKVTVEGKVNKTSVAVPFTFLKDSLDRRL
jgi:hypothetical protein